MLNENLSRDEKGELILINITEELVLDTIKNVICTMNMCTCDICRLHACAIALNDLAPKYVITTKGKLQGHITAEMITYHIQVLVATTKALVIIKNHPPH